MASVKVTLWHAVVPKHGPVRQTQRGLGLGTNYALLSGYSSIPRSEVRSIFVSAGEVIGALEMVYRK
jgi:hypothetical protein